MPVGRLETTETGEWLAPIGIASDLTEGCPVVLMPRLMEVRRDPNAQPSRVEDDVAAGLARHGLGQWKEFLADAAAAALIEEHALIALSGELRVAFLKFRVWSAPLRCYYNLLVLVSVSRLGSRTIIDIVIDPEDEPPPSRPYVSGRLGRAGKARSNRQPALVNLSLSESEVAVAVCRFPSQVSSAPRPPAGSHKWTSGRETNEGPAGGRRATDADNGTDPGHDRSSGVGIVHVAEHANDSSAFRHVTPRAVVVVHQAIRLLLGDLVGPLTRPGPAPKLPATCHVDATPVRHRLGDIIAANLRLRKYYAAMKFRRPVPAGLGIVIPEMGEWPAATASHNGLGFSGRFKSKLSHERLQRRRMRQA